MNKFLHSVLFVTVSSLPLVLTYVLKKKFKNSRKPTNDDFYHHAIFIEMKNFDCKQHLIDKKECCENCSFAYQKTLQNFISSAKAHKRGVHVRVITDQVMMQTKPVHDNFEKLRENGINYKVQPSKNSMMHHKFCVIDKEDMQLAKMFFGSLNLTSQGLVSNFDTVILTNNINIIERYSEEFEELWSVFQ